MRFGMANYFHHQENAALSEINLVKCKYNDDENQEIKDEILN